MLTYSKVFSDIVTKFAENELMLPVLANSIISQIDKGIVFTDFPFWKVKMPVTYDLNKNVVFVNKSYISPMLDFIRANNPIYKEKHRFKELLKGTFGNTIAGICYYGVHSYNKRNRGALIKNPLTIAWYKKFFFKSIYDFTKLTTLANKVTDSWTIPYLNVIAKYYEARAFSLEDFTDKQEKQLDFMLNELAHNCVKLLESWSFDYESIESFKGWFAGFSKEFKICFKNKNVIVTNFDQEFITIQKFEVLNLASLISANSAITTFDVLTYRYPAPPFRETYLTAEPMGQVINSLLKQNKLKYIEEIQTLAARGIAYLG